jgi:hypothetical protein
VTNFKEIVDIIKTTKTLFPDISGRSYYFLDEVSQVKDWQRAVKFLKDSQIARNDLFILTGSSAVDIRRGGERLPGRRGRYPDLDKILLPMNFVEFCKAKGFSPKVPHGVIPIREFWDEKNADILKHVFIFLPELESLLTEYMIVGGFPSALKDYIKLRQVSSSTLQVQWATIAGDIEKWGKDRVLALKLLDRLYTSLGTGMSWHSIARSIGFGSPITIADYINILAESFIIFILYFFDTSKRKISPKKAKKIYFLDPIFIHLASFLIQSKGLDSSRLKEEYKPKIAENIAAITIFRAVEKDILENIYLPQNLFYWRSSSHKEVDFLIRTNSTIIPVEVKYRNNIRPQELLTIKNSFGKGIVLSKEIFNLQGSVKIIPLSIFLWLVKGK